MDIVDGMMFFFFVRFKWYGIRYHDSMARNEGGKQGQH